MEETFRAEMLNGSQVGATRGERKRNNNSKHHLHRRRHPADYCQHDHHHLNAESLDDNVKWEKAGIKWVG